MLRRTCRSRCDAIFRAEARRTRSGCTTLAPRPKGTNPFRSGDERRCRSFGSDAMRSPARGRAPRPITPLRARPSDQLAANGVPAPEEPLLSLDRDRSHARARVRHRSAVPTASTWPKPDTPRAEPSALHPLLREHRPEPRRNVLSARARTHHRRGNDGPWTRSRRRIAVSASARASRRITGDGDASTPIPLTDTHPKTRASRDLSAKHSPEHTRRPEAPSICSDGALDRTLAFEQTRPPTSTVRRIPRPKASRRADTSPE